MRARLVFALGILLALQPLRAAPSWQPERTWVFAVGILRFQGKEKNDWPEEGRKDLVLLETLHQRGVPAAQICFLKNEEATAAALQSKLEEFVRRPQRGDTLIFYYAGHGGRNYSDPSRPVHFVPYDAGKSWLMSRVVQTIEEGFQGSRVLLTADCCHSGALAEVAAATSGETSYGTLTSSRASATSTGSWRFTECLIEIFGGSGGVDLAQDGSTTFSEAALYSDLKMAFHENQRATAGVAGGFPNDLILAEPEAQPKGPLVDRCEGRSEGEWYPARIIGGGSGKYLVTWPGWDATHDTLLAPGDLRPTGFKPLPSGTKVEIQWGRKWYPGKVLRSELGLLLVHYDGYTKADDEWVPMKRVRVGITSAPRVEKRPVKRR